MSSIDVRPKGYYTRWYLGSDGSRIPLCSYHVRKRATFSEVEYEPETAKPLDDRCSQTCADCKERERTQGDDYNLPLADHFESVILNCSVVRYAIDDIISTFEICGDKLKSSEHRQVIETEQRTLRNLLGMFDTLLGGAHSITAKCIGMLDDDGNEILSADDLEEED